MQLLSETANCKTASFSYGQCNPALERGLTKTVNWQSPVEGLFPRFQLRTGPTFTSASGVHSLYTPTTSRTRSPALGPARPRTDAGPCGRLCGGKGWFTLSGVGVGEGDDETDQGEVNRLNRKLNPIPTRRPGRHHPATGYKMSVSAWAFVRQPRFPAVHNARFSYGPCTPTPERGLAPKCSQHGGHFARTYARFSFDRAPFPAALQNQNPCTPPMM